MPKLLDQAAQGIRVGRYGEFDPKPVMDHSRQRIESLAR